MTGIHNESRFEERLLGLVRGERDAQLEEHVASCAECQASVFTLRQLEQYRSTTGGSLVEPPASLMARVTGLMTTVRPDLTRMQPVPREPLAFVRKIIADLILDSGLTPQVVGLRSSTDQRTRQLAFVSDVADLDLEITPREDSWSVTGQLGMDDVPNDLRIRFVPTDSDVMSVEAEGAVTSSVSNDGYFDVRLTPGEWVAAIDIDDATVLFQDISV